MAATKVGTLAIADLAQNLQTTVAEVDEAELAAVLNRELQAHNDLTNDFVNSLADTTEDRQRQAGTGSAAAFMEADEFARVPTQKISLGANLGFPLKKYDFAVGWTRSAFEMMTLADFAKRTVNVQEADVNNILTQAKRALYLSSNYTVTDVYQAPALSIDVKRLVNADSFAIENSPNGASFDSSTHNHYSAESALSAAGLLSAVNTVLEHFNGAQVEIDINSADEAGVRALTGFKEFTDLRVQLGTGQVATQRLDVSNIGNRAIGLFNGATVWVKPWAIDDYALVRVTGGAPKPLAYRVPTGPRKGLRLMAELATHPLHAQYFSRMFGFGVQSRVSAAVYFFGGASYTDPTIS